MVATAMSSDVAGFVVVVDLAAVVVMRSAS